MRRARFVSAFLAVLIFVSLFSACKKKDIILDNRVVREEDPWYESSRFKISCELQDSEFLSGCSIECSNDKIFAIFSIYNPEFYICRRTNMQVFDDSGNKLNELIVKAPDNAVIDNIYAFYPDKKGKKATAVISTHSEGVGFRQFFADLDLESGNLSDLKEILDTNGNQLTTNYSIDKVFSAGEYFFFSVWEGDDYSMFIFKDTKCLCKVDHSALSEIRKIDQCSYDEKNKEIIISLKLINGSECTCSIEPKSGRITNVEEYDYTNTEEEYIADYSFTKEGDLIRIDSLGNIYRYDPKKQSSELAISNNWYSPYFSDFSYETRVLSCTEDKAVIYSNHYSGEIFSTLLDNTVTVLKKADKNPHAGKSVLEISAPLDSYFSEYLSASIFNFNRTDDEYLIRIWSKYNTGLKVGRTYDSYNADADEVYAMILELQSSDAPDLVTDIQKYAALKDIYLEDLSDYLDPSVRDKIYMNVVDSCKIDDKQYFLPINIEIEGLLVDDSQITGGSPGMTFDEYDKFVSGSLYGFSPYDYPDSVYYNKNAFVLSCIDIMSAIGNDNIDFDTEQFREALRYAKDNYPDMDPLTADQAERNFPEARYVKINNYFRFIANWGYSGGSYSLIGTPSVDRTGPRFSVLECISVAAESDMKDGCRKFINYLFEGSFISLEDPWLESIVINKNVLTMETQKINKVNNNDMYFIEDLSFMGDLKLLGRKMADQNMADKFLKSIADLSIYCYNDPDLIMILQEETAPYFAGDRSADDVIKYLNDRIGKYIKEMD
ncbi:MAG: hypothetical protein K6F83_04440 [Clostridiales bacterium]|nr:hypothetical protein [Clostridiales bacterium]